MNGWRAGLLAMLLCLPAGCARRAAEPGDLSIEDWRQLPAAQRFTPSSLEHLKGCNPSLQTSEGWEAFERAYLKNRQDERGN